MDGTDTDPGEGLPSDDVDLGLGAAFGRGEAPAAPDARETARDPARKRTAVDALRASHGVEPSVDIESGAEPAAAPSSSGGGHIRTARYDVHDEIARGGMGRVYRVRDRDLRRSLAMKVLLGGSHPRTDLLNRFLEEAQVTAQLAHPGVVPVHELGVDEHGNVFFTMGLVRGITLSQVIRLARAGREGWTRTRALQVILRVCETIAFAHDKGVIHRDIKPDNVMVGRFGETYVMDWGLAKVTARGADGGGDAEAIESRRDTAGGRHASPIMTMDGVVVGTPAYMPPEQALGAVSDVDERADIYAIGTLLYELLTGHPPYADPGSGTTPHEVLGAVRGGPPKAVRDADPELPGELVAICEKAMAREREDRYPGVQQVAQDIQAFLEGRVVQAYRTGAVVELRKWIGRNRALATSLAAAALITVCGSIAFAIHAQNASVEIGRERDKEAAARLRAEGLRLSARASAELGRAPALALGLAIEGATRAAGSYPRTTLYQILAQLNERATLEGHASYVGAVAFTDDPDRLVSVGETDGQVIVWDLARRVPLLRLGGAADDIVRAAVSADGRRVAVLAQDGGVRIWDATDGRDLGQVPAAGRVLTASWDAAGQRLGIVTRAGQVVVLRPPAATPETAIDVGEIAAAGDAAILWSGDGGRLAVQGADGAVHVRDLVTGARLADLPCHAGASAEAATGGFVRWLDGGRQIVSWRTESTRPADGRESAEIWDVASAARVAAFGGDAGPCAMPLASESGLLVALPLREAASASERVVIWDVASRRERCRLATARLVGVLGFSPDGRQLISHDSGGEEYALALWDAETGALRAALRGHTYRVKAAAVRNDGLVATASADATVRLWRADSRLTDETTRDWGLAHGVVSFVRRDTDRAFVVADSRDRDGRVECRSLADGRTLYRLPQGVGEGNFTDAGGPPRCVVHVAASNRLQVLDVRDGRVLVDAPGPPEMKPPAGARAIFSADGSRFAVLHAAGIDIHEASDGARTARIALDHPSGDTCWSPEGGSLLTRRGSERLVLELDAATGAELRRFEGVHTGYVTSVLVDASGTVVATAAADRSVAIWDRRAARLVHRFRGLPMGDLILRFDPTGRFLLAWSAGAPLAILDVEERAVFAEVPVRGARSLCFDGGDALVSSADGILRIPLDPLAAARRVQPRPLTPLEVTAFEVGDADERRALVDAYADWTNAPKRVLDIGLAAVGAGERDRAARLLRRLDEIAPQSGERGALEAALRR